MWLFGTALWWWYLAVAVRVRDSWKKGAGTDLEEGQEQGLEKGKYKHGRLGLEGSARRATELLLPCNMDGATGRDT